MKSQLLFGVALLCMAGRVTPAWADAPPVGSDCEKGFFSRFVQAYGDDATNGSPSTAYLTPTPERRGLPAPFSSPPFPSAEWQLGGVDYPIGVPDEDTRGPLQQALGCTSFGKWMDDNRIEMLGWLNPS